MTHYSNTRNPIDFPKLSAIDKLWGQALDQAVPETYSGLSLTQIEKVKTVFAELIVRECAEVCYDHSNAAGCVDTAFGYGYKDCGDDIKRNFGVEL